MLYPGMESFSAFHTMCGGFLQVTEVYLDPPTGNFLTNLNWNTSTIYKIKKKLWGYIQGEDADTVIRLSSKASVFAENNGGCPISFSS